MMVHLPSNALVYPFGPKDPPCKGYLSSLAETKGIFRGLAECAAATVPTRDAHIHATR